MATAEVAAVEVVRALCGSVGLIAAVPLTTMLAAALVAPQAETANEPAHHGTGHPTGPVAGRVPYSPRRSLTPDGSALLFEQVLALHQPMLSHAAIGISGWPSLEQLPIDARQAATALKRLEASTRRTGSSRARKALTAARATLDLSDPDQLQLLWHCGPFSTDLRMWVEDDPVPVIESSEAFDGEPRITYRLDPGELDRLQVALDQAGLGDATLVARRSRIRVDR